MPAFEIGIGSTPGRREAILLSERASEFDPRAGEDQLPDNPGVESITGQSNAAVAEHVLWPWPGIREPGPTRSSEKSLLPPPKSPIRISSS